MAYKGLQKKGLQKKLDERAIKNKEFYKKLDQQVEEAAKHFDFKKLREEHKELAENIGMCPLSVMDLFEAMEAGTCMCLGIEVERPENAVADPSLVKIVKIVPSFMTAESFIDSSIYSLKKDAAAHGGFTQKGATAQEGSGLAQGAARENINACIPLYLFKEHWEIARRRAPPIYGLSVVADVMGYAPSQQLTIPFKVLIKAMEEAQANPSTFNLRVVTLLLQTC